MHKLVKKKFYYITNELLSDWNNEGMQSIHCIFMMIYAVYGLHLYGKDAV